jgi:peptidoglycan/xylan/chitin deacetylase (PgdA/CDA1 family)
LPNTDWSREIDEPKKLLEKITGKPVNYFAYPYGAWNEKAVEEVKEHGMKAAFQLSEQQSMNAPLFTIRRIMVSDTWSTAKLNDEIHFAFNQRNLARLEQRSSKKNRLN